MVVRRTKKILKRRGTRSPGYGSQKKHRGSGSRGGTGLAGLHKHKRMTSIKYYPDHFGKKGFKRPEAAVREVKTINLGDLDQMIDDLFKEKKIMKEKGSYLVDLGAIGYDKLLGSGRITHKIIVQAKYISSVATKKLEEAGCKAVTVGQDV